MTTPDQDTTDIRGETTITDRAVQRLAAAATASVPGTATVGGGLDRIAGMSYPRFDTQIDRLSKVVSVEAVIAVSWPSPANQIAEAVRKAITNWLSTMTGLAVRSVNVVIGNVVDGDRRVAPQAVAAARVSPRVSPVEISRSADVRSPGRRRVPAKLASTREIPVRVRPERRLAKVHVAPEQRLKDVKTANERPLREVRVAPAPEPAEVHTMPERPLREVDVPREAPLTAVHTPEPLELHSPQEPKEPTTFPVHTPRPIPLRPIRVHEPKALVPVRTKQTRLRPVRVTRVTNAVSPTVPVHIAPLHPSAPPQLPLQPIEIRPLAHQIWGHQEGGRYGRGFN